MTAKEKFNRGAKVAKLGRQESFIAFCRQHWRGFSGSLSSLLNNWLSSLLTWLTIGVTLTLPAGLMLLVDVAQQQSSALPKQVKVSLYLHADAGIAAITELRKQLQSDSRVLDTVYISPQQGLASFSERIGVGDLLAGLAKNPLPGLLVLNMNDTLNSLQIQALVGKWQAEPLVEIAQWDMQWASRLRALTQLGQRLVWVIAGLLAAAVALVIGNTIRVAIANSRQEIKVKKLVGATDAYVRRPFMYTGFWYGFGGSLVAVALLFLTTQILSGPLQLLFEQPPQLAQTAVYTYLLFFGTGLGYLGAVLAVSRELHKIQP